MNHIIYDQGSFGSATACAVVSCIKSTNKSIPIDRETIYIKN